MSERSITLFGKPLTYCNSNDTSSLGRQYAHTLGVIYIQPPPFTGHPIRTFPWTFTTVSSPLAPSDSARHGPSRPYDRTASYNDGSTRKRSQKSITRPDKVLVGPPCTRAYYYPEPQPS